MSCVDERLSSVKLDYLNKHLKGKDVLDVGAGDCLYSSWLAQKNKNLKVSAIDMLELFDVSSVNYIKHDLEKPLPFEPGSFDTIVAFDIVEHIANVDGLLQELRRVLKDDGVIIGSVPHDEDLFLPKYNLTFNHRSDLTHKRYYTAISLNESLSDKGFKVEKITQEGWVSPYLIAEFFHKAIAPLMKFLIKVFSKIGLIRNSLKPDLFFVATKNI